MAAGEFFGHVPAQFPGRSQVVGAVEDHQRFLANHFQAAGPAVFGQALADVRLGDAGCARTGQGFTGGSHDGRIFRLKPAQQAGFHLVPGMVHAGVGKPSGGAADAKIFSQAIEWGVLFGGFFFQGLRWRFSV